MSFYGLTTPKKINENSDMIPQIKNIYDSFYYDFIKNSNNRYLQGDFIFVKDEFKLQMHERFLHSISMKNKEFYSMYPCYNDVSYIDCNSRCKVSKSPRLFGSLNRALCFYRLSRVQWIPEIINYANNEDENIKIWRKEEKDLTNDKWRWKRYVRYENGLADYVLIFNEKYKEGKFNLLDFRTAYPVFIRNDKKRFDREYDIYNK